jgi:hypothetical protein
MTQYLLSVHHGELAYTEDEMQQMFRDVDAFNTDLQATSAWVFAGGLAGPEAATVVDGTGATVTTTDGPFLETKEHLGGFWIIEAPDLDAALEIAARGSRACAAPVEVRPFQPEP